MRAIKEFEGKNIYVSLNTHSGKRRYSGKCIEVVFMGFEQDTEIFMITIIDKFGFYVSFTNKEIEFIEVEKPKKVREDG